MTAVRWLVCLFLLVGVAEAYRPSIYQVDARVVRLEHAEDGRLTIEIKLPPQAVRLHGQPSEWTGIFMKDGHPIPGTGFRVRHKIETDLVVAVIFARDIHGSEVRIFAESGYFPTELSDPPDHRPISGHVRRALEADDGKTELDLGVGTNADPEDVTTAWTGVFTKHGHDIPDSTFEITRATKDGIRGLVMGRAYPSRTVRLYPPTSPVAPSARDHPLESIDRQVIAETSTDKKRRITIALGIGADADLVTTEWVGAFIDAGEVSKHQFKLQAVSNHLASAEVSADYLPSYTVRLFPPASKR